MNKLFIVFSKLKQGFDFKPLDRGFYAWNMERAGDFLIFVESSEDYYKFLYIPGADPFYLTKEDFHTCMKTGIVSLVEQLPKDIYEESLVLSCPPKTPKIQTHENYKN